MIANQYILLIMVSLYGELPPTHTTIAYSPGVGVWVRVSEAGYNQN